MGKHDRKCPNCDGAGERIFTEPFAMTPEMPVQDAIAPRQRIVECGLCTGTGLVEVDEYWEHA